MNFKEYFREKKLNNGKNKSLSRFCFISTSGSLFSIQTGSIHAIDNIPQTNAGFKLNIYLWELLVSMCLAVRGGILHLIQKLRWYWYEWIENWNKKIQWSASFFIPSKYLSLNVHTYNDMWFETHRSLFAII